MELSSEYKEIIEHYENCENYITKNAQIYQVLRGDLLPLIQKYFEDTVISPQARLNKVNMAVPINYPQKIMKVLSNLYTFTVERKASSNESLMTFYKKELSFDTVMQQANELFNGMRSCFIEIYHDKDKTKKLKIRAVPANKILVYSTDPVEPNIPNVFIKILRTIKKADARHRKGYREADLLLIYTKEKIMKVDTDGKVYSIEDNEWGFIPFVYINSDISELLPVPNSDLLQNTKQICSIMTDSVVCNYFQSFPIRVLINTDLEKSQIEINANTVMNLKKMAGENVGDPDFKEVPSTLDTAKSIQLAKSILNEILYCFDLEAQGAEVTAAKSGLALSIQNTALVDNRKRQAEYFRPAEKELWEKLALAHNKLIVSDTGLPLTYPIEMFDEGFTVDCDYTLPDTTVEQKQEGAKADSNGDKQDGSTES